MKMTKNWKLLHIFLNRGIMSMNNRTCVLCQLNGLLGAGCSTQKRSQKQKTQRFVLNGDTGHLSTAYSFSLLQTCPVNIWKSHE